MVANNRVSRIKGGLDLRGHPFSIAAERAEFLRLVSELERKVLDELAGAPFEHYRALVDSFTGMHRSQPAGFGSIGVMLTPATYPPLAFGEPQARALRKQLVDTAGVGPVWQWARNWRLNEEWVVDVAYQTLEIWRRKPPKKDDSMLHWGHVRVLSKPFLDPMRDPAYPPRPKAWDPLEESESGYQRRIDAYKAKARAVIRACGLIAARERAPERVRWLVYRHVCRQTYMEIAAAELRFSGRVVVEDTVRKAVESAAEELDLPLS